PTRRAKRHAAGGRSEHPARSPRIVRCSRHAYSDSLLDHEARVLARQPGLYLGAARLEPRASHEPPGEALSLLDAGLPEGIEDRKSTRLNSSHEWISYAVFCL